MSSSSGKPKSKIRESSTLMAAVSQPRLNYSGEQDIAQWLRNVKLHPAGTPDNHKTLRLLQTLLNTMLTRALDSGTCMNRFVLRKALPGLLLCLAQDQSAGAAPSFGLCNGTVTFQRVMQTILQGLYPKHGLVHLDDVLVFGKNIQEHNHNPKIGYFLRQPILFIGHIVSTEDMIGQDRSWAVSIHQAELRSFQYVRRYGGNP